ncbi:MAG: hypothetical protein JWP27_389 [Flaviaesturariibacter sp.]|nr:hypothetical protein [Flaviaesturariibacter sp.]
MVNSEWVVLEASSRALSEGAHAPWCCPSLRGTKPSLAPSGWFTQSAKRQRGKENGKGRCSFVRPSVLPAFVVQMCSGLHAENQPIASVRLPMESNSRSTESNSQGTESNSEGTESNSEGTESNSEDMGSNSEGMESNSESTESNSESTESNSEDLESNSESIESNSECTESNSKGSGNESKRTTSLCFFVFFPPSWPKLPSSACFGSLRDDSRGGAGGRVSFMRARVFVGKRC